jgi:hypothetical protein
MAGTGEVALDADAPVAWSAINQFTRDAVELELPQMTVGGTWLGQNADLSSPTPIVDEVFGLVGGITTIFQRIQSDSAAARAEVSRIASITGELAEVQTSLASTVVQQQRCIRELEAVVGELRNSVGASTPRELAGSGAPT